MKSVACVGILVADVLVEKVNSYPEKGQLSLVDRIVVRNGGNAMTAAINLKKLGVESYIVGKVGNDFFGNYLQNLFSQNGVDASGLKKDSENQTSASVLMIDESKERSFFHCKGANSSFNIDDIDMNIIKKSDFVFVTGSFLMDRFDGEQTACFLKKCKEMDKKTFLDVCWDASGKWGETLNPAMKYIDVFMPSIDEAKEISKKDEVNEMADAFFEKGVKTVVIKMGHHGSFLKENYESDPVILKSYKVDAVDTTGAGDSFCSGFIASHSRGFDYKTSLKFANATGAKCVTNFGATEGFSSYDEIIDFIRKEES